MKKINIVVAALVMAAGISYGQSTVTSFAVPALIDEINAIVAAIEGGTADIALDDGEIWVGNATDKQAAVAVSGDVTIANDGAVTIANEAVTAAKTAAAVQTSLGKADTAVQPADITAANAIALTPADAGSTTGTVTVAITDIAGDPADALASWWISDTSGGAASATNVDAVSVTTGTAIIAASSTIVNSAVSTGGALVIEVDMTAAGTNYVSVAVGGLIAEAQLVTE